MHFFEIELHIIKSKGGESVHQILHVLLLGWPLNQHVVYVNLHGSTYLINKHFIHQLLVCRPYVLQVERYYLVTVQLFISNETLFFPNRSSPY